jgi:DNA-binding response OmpR family regulator
MSDLEVPQSDRREDQKLENHAAGRILVIDDDPLIREIVVAVLSADGHEVETVRDGLEAIAQLEESVPDLIVCDVNMPALGGLEFVAHLRSDVRFQWVPLLFLSTRRGIDDVVLGLNAGADDYLTKPFNPRELSVRVQSKLNRPPVSVDSLMFNRRVGVLAAGPFTNEVSREHVRVMKTGTSSFLAVIRFSELDSVQHLFGARVVADVLRSAAQSLSVEGHELDVVGLVGDQQIGLLLPGSSLEDAAVQLEAVASDIAKHVVNVHGETLRITPSVGVAEMSRGTDAPTALSRATLAARFAERDLDLLPRFWSKSMGEGVVANNKKSLGQLAISQLVKVRAPIQVVVMLLASLVIPFFAYDLLDGQGFDLVDGAYFFVVVWLVITAALTLLEGVMALRREPLPLVPGEPEPLATAIIAAYLPNEAATLVETVRAFQEIDYPAGLQIIVAYNTPRSLPVEEILRQMAVDDPRIVVVRVEHSTSKAQNVNAVLSQATGRFIGMFDADHHPASDSFRRAWRWLSNGYDVVQGHCLVRNGGDSLVARLVAVEFESIYAVSHPGRARMHGFGIFGGSNGFWRTDLLHSIRMRGGMLTEDIDSSMRVVAAGGRIKSDPELISTELATVSWVQLWNQRSRWAQGWFQVCVKHLYRGVRTGNLTLRQKLGLLHLLGWREISPWIGIQIIPIITYSFVRGDEQNWFTPVMFMCTVFTLSVGPIQTFFAYKVGHRNIRQHKSWFFLYLLASSPLYTEYKNVISRISNVKELTGDHAWRVTPRSTAK